MRTRYKWQWRNSNSSASELFLLNSKSQDSRAHESVHQSKTRDLVGVPASFLSFFFYRFSRFPRTSRRVYRATHTQRSKSSHQTTARRRTCLCLSSDLTRFATCVSILIFVCSRQRIFVVSVCGPAPANLAAATAALRGVPTMRCLYCQRYAVSLCCLFVSSCYRPSERPSWSAISPAKR